MIALPDDEYSADMGKEKRMSFKSYISAFAICITIIIVSACAQKSPMLEEQSKKLPEMRLHRR